MAGLGRGIVVGIIRRLGRRIGSGPWSSFFSFGRCGA